MAEWAYNPITGNLDRIGQGGGGGGNITITGDNGPPLNGDVFAIVGQEAGASNSPVMDVDTTTGDVVIANNTWLTPYVVDQSTTAGLKGTYQTIQSAMDAAVTDGATLTNQKMVIVRYGTYVENLDIPPGIMLKGDAMVEQPGALPLFTEIRGNHTVATANLFRAENIYFTNVDPSLDMFTNNATNIFNFVNCVLNNGNSTGKLFSLDFNYQHFTNCVFFGTAEQEIMEFTGGNVIFENCLWPQQGNIANSGFIRFLNCSQVGQVICDNGQIIGVNSSFFGATNCISGSGAACQWFNCFFNSTGPAVVHTGQQYFMGCSSYPGSDTSLYEPGNVLASVSAEIQGTVLTSVAVDSNTTALNNHYLLEVDTSGGPVTITLTSLFPADRSWIIKDATGNAISNNITIQVAGGTGTIDGESSVVIAINYGAVCIKGSTDGVNYLTVWSSFGVFQMLTEDTTAFFKMIGNDFVLDFLNGSNILIGSDGSLTSGGANVGLGVSALAATTVGESNTAIGSGALGTNQGGTANTSIGNASMSTFNPGTSVVQTHNTSVGNTSLNQLVNGIWNTVIGSNAGFNYTSNESSNILIRNTGTVGENNTIRIGTPGSGSGQQNRAFMAGITGVTVGSSNMVGIDSNGQLSDLGPVPSAFTWQIDTSATAVSMVPNKGYVQANPGAPIIYTLPLVCPAGSIIRLVQHTVACQIQQNAGQSIAFGTSNTTVGVTGSLTTTDIGDSVELLCVVADTTWRVISWVGGQIQVA